VILAQYGRTRLAALPMRGIFFDGNKRLFNHFIENPKLDAMLHLHYKFMSYKFLNLRTCPIPDIEKKNFRCVHDILHGHFTCSIYMTACILLEEHLNYVTYFNRVS